MSDQSASAPQAAASEISPRVPGYIILPTDNNVIDMAGLLGNNAARLGRQPFQGILVSTITGGVPDASDELPEGTIIVTP